MTPYNIALLANQPLTLDLGGTLFLVDTAPSPFKVEFMDARGGRRDELLDAAQAADYAAPEQGFSKITLTSTVNQNVKFYVSRGKTGTNRFSGNVSITGPLDDDNADALAVGGANSGVGVIARLLGFNGATFDRLRADDEGAGAGALRTARFGDEITKAGRGFAKSTEIAAGGAGIFAHAQVFNPVGSAIIVYVDRLHFWSDVNARFDVGLYNAALTTGFGSLNRDSGGAAGVAELRGQSNNPQLGIYGLWSGRVLGNTPYTLTFPTPYRLSAGEGLIVSTSAANLLLGAGAQWREKAV